MSQHPEVHRKEQGDELTDDEDHPRFSLICSPPACKMDSPYSARFRLARPGRHPGGTGEPGGCR
jgi:hypothetical protein